MYLTYSRVSYTFWPCIAHGIGDESRRRRGRFSNPILKFTAPQLDLQRQPPFVIRD
jgi:hypothetical protein